MQYRKYHLNVNQLLSLHSLTSCLSRTKPDTDFRLTGNSPVVFLWNKTRGGGGNHRIRFSKNNSQRVDSLLTFWAQLLSLLCPLLPLTFWCASYTCGCPAAAFLFLFPNDIFNFKEVNFQWSAILWDARARSSEMKHFKEACQFLYVCAER